MREREWTRGNRAYRCVRRIKERTGVKDAVWERGDEEDRDVMEAGRGGGGERRWRVTMDAEKSI